MNFSLRTDSGVSACVIGAPVETNEAFAGVLSRNDLAPGWRDCLTGDLTSSASFKDTSCDVPHLGEYLGTARAAPSLSDCQEAVYAYAGFTYESRLSEIQVHVVTSTTPAHPDRRCLMIITGGRPLDASLRLIKNANLPRVR